MSEKRRRKPYKRIALVLSLCAILASALLGTGASLAWFSDTSEDVENIFHFADFEVKVSYWDDDMWKEIQANTKIFDENTIYEPGYVQVVYLMIENKGDRPFDFKTTVTPENYVAATNVYGEEFELQDYLRFGLDFDVSATALEERTNTRDEAKAIATENLGVYFSNNSDYTTGESELGAGSTAYAALVVAMPETVGNEANYRGDDVPEVHLKIIVSASQQQNP